MTTIRQSATASLILISGLLSCGRGSGSDVAVVTVDGEVYEYSDFEAFVARNVAQDPNTLSDAVLSVLFEGFIDELCLLRLAEGGGQDALELHSAAPPEPVSRAEAQAYFDSNPGRYDLPERVVLGQILLQDEETAYDIRERVVEGVPLDEVAEGVEGAVFSGYQRDVTRADLPSAFEETIFSLEVPGLSPVMAADYGFHLFEVRERLPAERPSFEEALPQIERELGGADARDRSRNMVAAARVRYNVELQPRNLPFALIPHSNP